MMYYSTIIRNQRNLLLYASLSIVYTLHHSIIKNDNKTTSTTSIQQQSEHEYNKSLFLPSSEHIIHYKNDHLYDKSNSTTTKSSSLITTTTTNKQHSSDFIIVYDKKTRSPKYTIERLHATNITCPDDLEASLLKKKRKPFYTESSIVNDNFKVI